MKPSFKKQLFREIDAIHAETGSTGPEGYAILRRIANGNDRDQMVWGFKEFKKTMASLEEKYFKGDREAAVSAIYVHLATVPDFPLPRWLSAFLAGGAFRFTRYEARSLDDALGTFRKKGFHLKAARMKQQIGFAVWMECQDLIGAGRPIDDGLFEEVGEKYGIGKTKASEYFYEMKGR